MNTMPAATTTLRTAIVGLPPEYSYPGDTELWWRDTTSQAANLGASFITRSLMRQLDADWVPVSADPREVAERYDCVVLSLATHLHRRRDVSPLAEFVEAVGRPVHAFSLGVEDYVGEQDLSEYHLDETVLRLLRTAAEHGPLGCRGEWSAEVLATHGFQNVVPFGCPSVFWQLTRDLRVLEPPNDPDGGVLGVFHRSLVDALPLLDEVGIWLGQDFQDEAILTDHLDSDHLLQQKNRAFFGLHPDADAFRSRARAQGLWMGSFDRWLAMLASARVVVGPRLHGCVAALTHGVPALLLTRDLRGREVAGSLGLPHLPLAEAARLPPEKIVGELVAAIDLDTLRTGYRAAFDSYSSLLGDLGLPHRLEVNAATSPV